ncbi:MAG: hypothetical protein L3J06_00460 [Cyclobacteriaceae bacterium]|nr:hypothetical protein [Cyclobacteriaceae bacterium]
MNILITGVGGPTPRSFAIALKKYGNYKNYHLIGTDINPYSIGLYQRGLFDYSYIIPKAADTNYWQAIETIISKHQIEYAIILPELEVEVWSKRQALEKLPCNALIPDTSVVDILVDKAKMTTVLDKLGVVPQSYAFEPKEAELNNVFDALATPFWVRSTKGTSGLGSLKVDNLDSLKNWIQINPRISEFIASTYLPGRNLAVKLLYFNEKLVRSATAERVNYIMAKVAPSGITGNTSFGRLLNEPALVKSATKAMDVIFESTNASKHGFFTIDFKEDSQGVPFITEINVRHVAFTQCFAAGGANFAEDTVRLLSEDTGFDQNYKMYEFEKDLIFLRDVDNLPILMKESELLNK